MIKGEDGLTDALPATVRNGSEQSPSGKPRAAGDGAQSLLEMRTIDFFF